MKLGMTELIITFGHQSNDWAITTRGRPLVVASGQVWLVINTLVEMSFFVRSDRSLRQSLRNGEKGSKWSIRRYCGCNVSSMPRKPMWSLSTALYVRSTKLNYNRSKVTGEIGCSPSTCVPTCNFYLFWCPVLSVCPVSSLVTMYDIVGYHVIQLLHTLIVFIFLPSLLPSCRPGLSFLSWWDLCNNCQQKLESYESEFDE